MKAVVQRVSKASVAVEGEIVGSIGRGLVVLIGFSRQDSAHDIPPLVDKILNLRIFEDEQGKMNRSLFEVGGEVLVVSQFTLLGDTRRGRRPNFMDAASPDMAQKLYEEFVQEIQRQKVKVQTGRFQAHMEVQIYNDGPVTLIVER
ncbi:MAG: D-tyrosyl-tRNA(Tyr) deacylase [bacterium]|nr:D-tyrosyl-tRNA(Tyr) deacylase [bacterium]